MTEKSSWHEILNAHTGAGLTGPQASVWENELRIRFTSPPLGPEEVNNAARRLGEHLASGTGEYRRKPTLPDLIEQINWTRNRSGNGATGERETLEDAVCSIMRGDACPHFRFSRAMAPSRSKYRAELMEALARAGKPVERDIRKHPRFMQRPADPFVRDQMGDLIERHAKAGTLDEDVYLREVERMLAGARMERIAVPVNDRFARVANHAAAGVASKEVSRTCFEEDSI